MNKYTSCEGILIARGACHNPAIFKDIKKYWTTNSQNEDLKEKAKYLYSEHKKPLNE